MVLEVIYWVILLLCLASNWFPDPFVRYSRFIEFVLFVIIGMRIFGLPH